MKLKKHIIEFEKAFNFVRDNLESINNLSDVILNHLDFKRGNFYTLLPEEANIERIYDFSGNEIIPQKPYKTEIYNLGGKNYIGVEIVSIDKEVSKNIWQLLQSNKDFMAIFDDSYILSSDKNLQIGNSKLIFKNKEVYYLLDKDNTEKDVFEVLRTTSHTNHALGLVFDRSHIYAGANLDFADICQNIFYVSVGAYDGEGYIFWEPNR